MLPVVLLDCQCLSSRPQVPACHPLLLLQVCCRHQLVPTTTTSSSQQPQRRSQQPSRDAPSGSGVALRGGWQQQQQQHLPRPQPWSRCLLCCSTRKCLPTQSELLGLLLLLSVGLAPLSTISLHVDLVVSYSMLAGMRANIQRHIDGHPSKPMLSPSDHHPLVHHHPSSAPAGST